MDIKVLNDLCDEVNNWFEPNHYSRHFGDFEIVNGAIYLPFLQNGQYFRIVGSVFNDGVYQYPVNSLKDENFNGAVWEMSVPPAVEELVTQISNWEEKNADVINSPYTSESFGGYSYTKKTDSTTDGVYDWRSQFRKKLNKWRKICRY